MSPIYKKEDGQWYFFYQDSEWGPYSSEKIAWEEYDRTIDDFNQD